MKVLIIFALALATAAAAEKWKSRNIVVPAGRPEGRIINGYEAYDGLIPYQVGLSLKNGVDLWFVCGGSLLSNTKVLTAAHCFKNIVEGMVYLGSAKKETSEVTREFTRDDVTIHSGFNKQTLENDIAIINIPYAEYSENIQPVKLPSSRTVYSSLSGEVAMASGWGSTHPTAADYPTTLQYGYLRVLPNTACEKVYANIFQSQVCVAAENRISTCMGDSGGPLVLYSTKEQIGITSGGSREGCGKGAPTVFTRVVKYLGWIRENAGV